MIRIAPQHQLISFVVECLRVPWRSEPAGVARPVIIAIAIDHGATRSQEAAVVEWPSSRYSVAHQCCLRGIECVAMSAIPPKADIRRPLNDDVSPSAGDDSFDLRLLGLRHSKLVKCLLEIVEKGLPLRRRYHEMLV